MRTPVTPERTRDFLVQALAKLLKANPSDIDTQIAFDRYGLDSAGAVELTGLLSEWCGMELEPTLLYDYPTIDHVTALVSERAAAGATGTAS